MTKKEKDLLLIDLSARLPYGFTIYRPSDNANLKISNIDDFAHFLEYSDGKEFKPYLRPISSMTKEEEEEMKGYTLAGGGWRRSGFDWLNAHHFDYRGLILIGLALEAPKDMYK